MLVGGGAGGAIAAAFGAPLTGAFYAFELIVGAYSLANAILVFAATLAASLTTRAIIGAPYDSRAPKVAPLTFVDYGALIGLGLVAAAVGGRWRIDGRRPGALQPAGARGRPWRARARLLLADNGDRVDDAHRAQAVRLSRFASVRFSRRFVLRLLFVGSLLGKLYSIGVDALAPSMGLETTACVLVGMGALSAAIVGGPLTMTFLVLESTGNLGVAGGALAASIATTLAVRATFGYSFTTWRLHLRGETIRGGRDVGWLGDLTVGRMMAPAPPRSLADQSIRGFREAYPIGSTNVVVAVDQNRRHQGLIQVAEAHAQALENGGDGGPDRGHPHLPATVLHPDDNIRRALDVFGAS